jgi:hypothetical protein
LVYREAGACAQEGTMKTFMSRRLSSVTLIGAVTASLYAVIPAKAAVLN